MAGGGAGNGPPEWAGNEPGSIIKSDRALPGLGVYTTRARVAGRSLTGATNIGRRPTFDAGHISIETYLLDFEGDLYGERMDLEIVERIRGEVKFESVEELKAQIARDVDVARSAAR